MIGITNAAIVSPTFGLFILSVVLVQSFRQAFFPADPDKPGQPGIMNRCPWPFIFFHDIKTGMKDSPTWVVITWFVLWKVWKFSKTRVAVV